MAATEQAYSASSSLLAALRAPLPPFPFYTTGEDNIRVVSYNSVAGVALKINARSLAADGTALPDSWDHVPNTDRSAKTQDYVLSGTTLVNLTVFASTGGPLVGQCYVVVQLVRGTGAPAIVLGTILAGFMTANVPLGFPGSPIVTPMEGEPVVRQIVGTTPAQGVQVSETVPTGARWDLQTFVCLLTTPNTTTNIQPILFVFSGGNTFFTCPSQQLLAGGYNNPVFTWLSGYVPPTVANSIADTASLPVGIRLTAGSNIQLLSFPAQSFWGQPKYTVREWLDI